MFVLKGPYFTKIKKEYGMYIIETGDPSVKILFFDHGIDLKNKVIHAELYNELEPYQYYDTILKIELNEDNNDVIYITDYKCL